MYENESAAVRAGIDFLQALTEKDYLLDPTFDVLDLEQKLIAQATKLLATVREHYLPSEVSTAAPAAAAPQAKPVRKKRYINWSNVILIGIIIAIIAYIIINDAV